MLNILETSMIMSSHITSYELRILYIKKFSYKKKYLKKLEKSKNSNNSFS